MARMDWDRARKASSYSPSDAPTFRGQALRMMTPAQRGYLRSLLSPDEYEHAMKADLTMGQAGMLIAKKLRDQARRGTVLTYDEYDGPVEVTVGSGRRAS